MQSMSTRSGHTTTWLKVAMLAAALTIVAVGCGSSSKSTQTSGTTAQGSGTTQAQPETTSQPADVSVAKSSLGSILVDSKGMTIYIFTKDTGTTSACTGACLQAWPPVVATASPTAGQGVTAKLTGAMQASGTSQLAVNGQLVYTFAKDAKPGDVTGQGFGGLWYVLSPAGEKIMTSAPTSASTPG